VYDECFFPEVTIDALLLLFSQNQIYIRTHAFTARWPLPTSEAARSTCSLIYQVVLTNSRASSSRLVWF